MICLENPKQQISIFIVDRSFGLLTCINMNNKPKSLHPSGGSLTGSPLTSNQQKIVDEWKVRFPQVFYHATFLLCSTYGLECQNRGRAFVYLERELSRYLPELFNSQWFWSNMDDPFGNSDDYSEFITKLVERSSSKIGHGSSLASSDAHGMIDRLRLTAKSVQFQLGGKCKRFGEWVEDLTQAVDYEGTTPVCKKRGIEMMVAHRFFYRFNRTWFFDQVADSYRSRIKQRGNRGKRATSGSMKNVSSGDR